MYIIRFIEVPGSITPQATLERTWFSVLSLYISTSRVSTGGDGGGGEGGGNCGGIGGGGSCTMIPEVPNLSVDWIIPTTEAPPMSSRDIVKIDATMRDLLSVIASS